MTYLDRIQLREPVPAEEACHCAGHPAVHLRYAFSEFPIFCTDCTGQVFPSALEISEDLAARIVGWSSVYAALYSHWLSSGEYEAFARLALLDPAGEVNRQGMELASSLNGLRLTYYWWFRESDTVLVEGLSCPLCGGVMEEHATRRFCFCHRCRVSC